ncbi:MAG: sigma 54-interacting transcriptional regulator [Clostridia bacterium]|nr:sigma 54-interacting transcriptional regulator [Clostridia bacterium]
MKDVFTASDILEAIKRFYSESIFITDGEGNVIFVNEIGAQRLGPKANNILGRNVDDLVREGVYGRSTTRIAIETKKPYTATINPKEKESNVSKSVPVIDKEGNVRMVVTANMSLKQNKEWKGILDEQKEIAERLKREIDNLRQNDNKIIANDPETKKVFANIDIIAPTDSNVIILGESGTGKDLTARYIHEHSPRKDEAFISINCAAIPEPLLESELFGYESGAFTGASSKGKMGLFEAANGGTLFLDEIGEMPLGLQSKLLNAIEDKSIRKVGGVKSKPVDVRIICATNADLMTLVKEKKFREDLYYRIAVFTVRLLPLRERPGDILPLAGYFLEEMNKRQGTSKYLSDAAKESMLMHSWPGNIRELRNVVERIFVISYTDSLDFLPTPTFGIPSGLYEADKVLPIAKFDNLKDYLEDAEKRYIESVVEESETLVEAARKLGIDRTALYRKLKKFK